MLTAGWLSEAVENTSDFLVGIVVFASINLVKTEPIVSIPKESGVTSNKIRLLHHLLIHLPELLHQLLQPHPG
jgi:hypothetical protein